MLSGKSVAIAGGGIAGLTAAIAVARQGAYPTVFEQAAQFGAVGAGIQISPNGFAVLDALGLGPALRDRADTIRTVAIHDGLTGRRSARLDLGRASGPTMALHRGDLIEVLAGAAVDAGADIRFDQHIDATAGLREFDLIIGADGLHSRLRAHLNTASAPFFTGQIAWRAVVDGGPDVPSQVRVDTGPGAHVVSYPLRGGTLTNLVAVEEQQAWSDESWSATGDPTQMRRNFVQFGEHVQGLLARVDVVHRWGLFRHPIAERWHDGTRIALIGDAAHPMLPFMAQGAVMAIEDAWALAQSLADLPPDQALVHYHRHRLPRVGRTIRAAEANARNYHLRHPLTRAIAHSGLRAISALAPGALAGRFRWLYDYDITAAWPRN